MRKLTQPWKLRRSFGSQSVGCVAGPRWPEACIAAQVIPSQSSRRTFREGQSPTADLPTRVPFTGRSSSASFIFKRQVGDFALGRASRTRRAFPSLCNGPNACTGVMADHQPTVPKTLVPNTNSEEHDLL
jgi:hypothetical protein